MAEERAGSAQGAGRDQDPASGRNHSSAKAADWNEPRSPVVPRPTYWPATLALSVCFALWGVLTSVWMIVVGMAASGLAIAGWIRELDHDPIE
ncbi:MAG: cytochrome c oxidase subunit 4 [Myxococcales bacterium]|jgi:hypothetical protein